MTSGLPLHPLVVHAAIVLLPLASIGSIAMAASTAWSRRFGSLTVVVAWLALAAAVVARATGWQLADEVGLPFSHATAGTAVLVAAIVVALAATGFWLVDRGIPGNRRRPAWFRWCAVALVIACVAAGVVTVQAAVSGAQATWSSGRIGSVVG